MDKAKLMEALIEVETKGLRFSNKSFECGAHTNVEAQSAMRQSDAEFSNAISNLREMILSEGV
jgi:hypothetical protein